jgi:hypothetical protein
MRGISRIRGSVRVDRWTLERFGLSPPKLSQRLVGGPAPSALCVSIPKSGTHLLERAICLHPRFYRKLIPTVSDENIARWRGLDGLLARLRSGQIAVSHLRFKPAYPEILVRRETRGFFLVRDPRELVVSQVHYVSKRKDHRLHTVFAQRADLKDKLRLAIAGDVSSNLPSIAERLDYFVGWLDSGCLIVRFEDLIGPQGGGDAERQHATVRSIFEHLGAEADDAAIRSVSARLFSADSPTFRRGTVGGWMDVFDDELDALFERVVGDRASPFGYGSRTGP